MRQQKLFSPFRCVIVITIVLLLSYMLNGLAIAFPMSVWVKLWQYMVMDVCVLIEETDRFLCMKMHWKWISKNIKLRTNKEKLRKTMLKCAMNDIFLNENWKQKKLTKWKKWKKWCKEGKIEKKKIRIKMIFVYFGNSVHFSGTIEEHKTFEADNSNGQTNLSGLTEKTFSNTARSETEN